MNLIVSGQWFPEYSGVGSRVKKIYKELNIDYVVISGIWQNNIIDDSENNCKNIKKYNLNMNGNIKNKIMKKLSYLLNLFVVFLKIPFHLYIIKKRFGNIDTIHTLRGGGFLYFYVVFWSKFIFKEFTLVVECVGGDSYNELIKSGNSAFGKNTFSFVGRYIFTYVIKKADYIIYASEHLKSKVPNNKSTSYIRNAYYDKSIFYPINGIKKEELKKKYNIPEQKKIFLTIGMINSLKNQLFIANTLKKMEREDWIWLIVGNDNDEFNYLNKIKDTIDQRKIIYINEWNDKPYEYYQISDIYLFASKREGNNNTVNEALMSGLPIIILDNGCYNHLEQIRDNYNLSIQMVNKPELFQESLEYILSESINSKKIHQTSAEVFNEEKYYAIYKTVLGIK